MIQLTSDRLNNFENYEFKDFYLAEKTESFRPKSFTIRLFFGIFFNIRFTEFQWQGIIGLLQYGCLWSKTSPVQVMFIHAFVSIWVAVTKWFKL